MWIFRNLFSPYRRKCTVVMTLRVRDEEDILRENIEFHRAQGVDHFIIADNLSKDSTPRIIEEFEQKGLVSSVADRSVEFEQAACMTTLARQAKRQFDADWVINNDADEFWIPREGDLKSALSRLPDKVNVAVAERHDCIRPSKCTGVWHQDMIYRKSISVNAAGRKLLPKVAHRGHPDARVSVGNHSVKQIGKQHRNTQLLEILHFPMRSRKQFENKVRVSGAAIERSDHLPFNVARHMRHLYKIWTQGELDTYIDSQLWSEQAIATALASGNLQVDRRVADVLSQSRQ